MPFNFSSPNSASRSEDLNRVVDPCFCDATMQDDSPYFVIYGQTTNGQRFRPSDWAERLAGVLAPYRPGTHGPSCPISYSPYALPQRIDGLPCVVVDNRLRQIEPLAWKFAIDFARDNDLKTASGDEELWIPAHHQTSA